MKKKKETEIHEVAPAAETPETAEKKVETSEERVVRLHNWLLQETYPDILENHPEDRNMEWEKFALEKGPFEGPSPEDMVFLIATSLAAVDVAASLEDNLKLVPLTGRRLIVWAIQSLKLEPTTKAKLVVIPVHKKVEIIPG